MGELEKLNAAAKKALDNLGEAKSNKEGTHMPEVQGSYIRPELLAKLFNFEGVRRIQQLTQDGVIETVEVLDNGKKARRYDLIPTIQRYVKFLQDKAYGREEKKSVADREGEKLDVEIKLKKTKASIAELELQELEGKMHRSEDVEAMTTDLAITIRSMLLSLPGRLAVEVANIDKAEDASITIQKEVNLILNELANYKYDPEKYKKRVMDRQGWESINYDEQEE